MRGGRGGGRGWDIFWGRGGTVEAVGAEEVGDGQAEGGSEGEVGC